MILLMQAIVVVGLAFPARAQSPGAADLAAIARGQTLFNDPRLSASGTVSCATCHPANGHTDNRTYVGLDPVADGDPRGRSTPTLWSAGVRQAWSWAGTAPSLEANIRSIIVNRMKGPEPGPDTVAALAAYVRSLPPPANRFIDADGGPTADAPAEIRRGFDLFVGAGGCGTCHVLPSFDKREPEDVGSGGTFKVPALRAVGQTGPWFHDGRYATLEEAVRVMWDFNARKIGSSRAATAMEIADLVAYLKAL